MNILCSSERRKGGGAKGAKSSPLAGGGSGAAMAGAEEIEERDIARENTIFELLVQHLNNKLEPERALREREIVFIRNNTTYPICSEPCTYFLLQKKSTLQINLLNTIQ